MRLIFILSLLLCALYSSAQTTYPISGKLLKKSNKEAVIGATVFAITPDSTLAGAAVSDDEGKFTLELKRGEYEIRINYLGLKTLQRRTKNI